MGFGRVHPTDPHETFCMTVLGLKLSRRANAVSSLHGEVSRAMWTGLYPGKPEDEVPIGHITNGVHVPSWLAPQMCRLYDRHLGVGLATQQRRSHDLGSASKTSTTASCGKRTSALKAQLIEFVRRRACRTGRAPRRARRDSAAAQQARLAPTR